MKRLVFVLAAGAAISAHSRLEAAGGFYGDPPDEHHAWAVHDMNRPQPPRVEPGTFSTQQEAGRPPSDAVILFDGTEAMLAQWEADKTPAEATKWIVKGGTLQCVPGSGYIRTKESFGDCHLHVEWSAPTEVKGDSQGRGNSGVFLMGQVEVQVLDNYNNPTYADGFAGSVYGVNPPLANPLNAPGEWQVYDIVFRRPIHVGGKLVDPGYLTVFCNGVLLQDHTPLEGGGGHKARSKDRVFPEKGPLKLQDHGNPVRYRNIWYCPLPKRAIEGGETSFMSAEATAAKRAEIAKEIRADAAKLNLNHKLLRLMESLCYEKDEAVVKQCEQETAAYAASLKDLPPKQLEAKKGDIMQMHTALQYLTQFKIVDFPAREAIAAVVKARGWDKKQ